MEFELIDTNDIIGTSKQGYTTDICRAELEEIFGTPKEFDAHDKTTTEWDIRFADGTIGTIYDWKRDCEPDFYEDFEWNIGGNDIMAAIHINDLIEAYRAKVLS